MVIACLENSDSFMVICFFMLNKAVKIEAKKMFSEKCLKRFDDDIKFFNEYHLSMWSLFCHFLKL